MPAALAIFAHPDDIEFRAAGTLLLLGAAGWDLHYCNLASGQLGSTVMTSARTAAVRRGEARAAARQLGAKWHPSIGRDLELFYSDTLIRRVCALIREVRPSILLTHPPRDYMEDHTETCRIVVTAAFARNIPNYRSTPARQAVTEPVCLYHSMPHGLRGPLRERWIPEGFVDVSSVRAEKRAALACHTSQKEWLDASQGMDSYLDTLDAEARAIGRQSRAFQFAEGWTRHASQGFAGESFHPLRDALGSRWKTNPRFNR